MAPTFSHLSPFYTKGQLYKLISLDIFVQKCTELPLEQYTVMKSLRKKELSWRKYVVCSFSFFFYSFGHSSIISQEG